MGTRDLEDLGKDEEASGERGRGQQRAGLCRRRKADVYRRNLERTWVFRSQEA